MKRADALSNNDLMAACRESGKGGGWEAEAIEHWRWQMRNGEGKERVLAWVKLHSVARGSPKCIDEAGRPLRVESCAADLGLALHTVQNHCTVLVAEGRIRLKKTQLWYRADVPEKLPETAVPADATEEENSWVHGNFPSYVVDFYWKQSAEKRTAMLTAMRALVGWRNQAFLEGLAGLRHEISRVEVSTLQALGLPKIVLPKKAAQDPHWFQPMLLDEPSFVHGNGTAAVSTAVNTADPGGVQGGASLLPFRADQTLAPASPAHPKKGRSVSQSLDGPTDRPSESDDYGARHAAVKTLLIDEYGRRFPGETPSSRLCGSILTALDGAPLERLRAHIRQRMQSATGMGFAVSLASDVGRRWIEEKESHAKVEAASERHAQANREETEILCQETLNDPRASEDEKKFAREFLTAAAAGGAS